MTKAVKMKESGAPTGVNHNFTKTDSWLRARTSVQVNFHVYDQ